MLYSFFVFVVFVRGGFCGCFGGFGAVPVFLIFFSGVFGEKVFYFMFFCFSGFSVFF